MNIKPKKNHSLRALNTLAVTSTADYFLAITDSNELEHALTWAKQNRQPVSILGGGSNVLLDERISGLVLQPKIAGMQLVNEDGNFAVVKVGAGENWHNFVCWSLDQGYFGLENLALIPGSVGAAPIQNIGAYGVEVASSIERVHVYDPIKAESYEMTNKDCAFAYRDSLFKNTSHRHLIITYVYFRLRKTPNINLSYPALKAFLTENQSANPSAVDVAEAVCTIRKTKLPDPMKVPNVGSFFKNPVVSKSTFEALQKHNPSMPFFEFSETQVKLAAAWLIDQSGWKGKQLAGVSVHSTQALVIVNPKKQSLRTVLVFAGQIQTDVNNKFGIELEIEPQKLSPSLI